MVPGKMAPREKWSPEKWSPENWSHSIQKRNLESSIFVEYYYTVFGVLNNSAKQFWNIFYLI